jgi:hypothetical protein
MQADLALPPELGARRVLGVVYISKRAAVASIRGMPAAAAGHPLFYTVKEFGRIA